MFEKVRLNEKMVKKYGVTDLKFIGWTGLFNCFNGEQLVDGKFSDGAFYEMIDNIQDEQVTQVM